jgi:hypothetical protein
VRHVRPLQIDYPTRSHVAASAKYVLIVRMLGAVLLVLLIVTSGGIVAFDGRAFGQERRPYRPLPPQEKRHHLPTAPGKCEVSSRTSPSSACIKCAPGYLLMGGLCQRAGDFGLGPTR